MAEWGRLCSCHGIPHLAQARSLPTLIIWALVVTATWVAFFYLLIITLQDYLDYDTTITVDVSAKVTVCLKSVFLGNLFSWPTRKSTFPR